MDEKIVSILGVTQSLFENFEAKVVIGGIAGLLSFFISPDGHLPVVALFVLVCFDFISGLIVARKTHGEVITSKKTVITPIKFAIFFMAFGGARMVEIATNEMIPFIDETVIGVIAFNEFWSMLENMSRLGFNFPKKVIEELSNLKNKNK
jgi:toxin secretion/phage lysis holin